MNSDLHEQSPTDKTIFEKIKEFFCCFNASNVLVTETYFTKTRGKF